MDKISGALNSSGIGEYVGNVFLNNFCYADDLCLISLSFTALFFKSKSIKITQPSFFLNLLKISVVESWRYLGITISTKKQ